MDLDRDGLRHHIQTHTKYNSAYCQDNVPVRVIIQLLEAVGYTVTPRTPAAQGL